MKSVLRWEIGIFGFFFIVGLLADDEPTTPSRNTAAAATSPTQTVTTTAQPSQKTTLPKRSTAVAIRSTSQSATKNTQALYVTGSVVNARSGPGTSYQVLAQLPRGTKVQLAARKEGSWVELKVASLGQTVWMHGKYLSPDAPVQRVATTTEAQPRRGVRAPTSSEINTAIKQIIAQSINAYPGSCPCPYNRDRAGRRCGGRSAWSRPGGYSPMCYDTDISQARLRTYFARVRGVTY